MLGDSILVIIGMMLMVMAVQPLMETSNRNDPVEVTRGATLALMGIFIIFYWNSVVP